MKSHKRLTALIGAVIAMSVLTPATPTLAKMSVEDLPPDIQAKIKESEKTEIWDPEPDVVSALPGQPPSDAIVLFNGNDLSAWVSAKGGDAPWQITDGAVTVVPRSGDIHSREAFCDVQLHLEWRTPVETEGLHSQQRGNSGVFFQRRYEIQVLDSYDNRTYANGQAASLYKQGIPLANATRAPGEWQTYDIVFTAPRFDGDSLASPGYVTVLHNGVLVQNHTEIQGGTVWIGQPAYEAHGCAPLRLQDHGNPVSYRNIWVRKL